MNTYFYRPLKYYNGEVLKCAGIATPANMAWFTEYCEQHPSKNAFGETIFLNGVVLVNGFKGDKIHANTHQPF